MKERPILFSGAMVRALLDGSKTQTRRVMKNQPYISHTSPPNFSDVEVGDLFICPDYCPTTPVRGNVIAECESLGTYHCMGQKTFAEKHSPYGVIGDRLWVRETFFAYGRWETRFSAKKGRDESHFIDMTVQCDRAYQYAADAPDVPVREHRGGIFPGWWKRPAIHMPHAVSRMKLGVGNVRIERLNEISESDAQSEGCAPAWLDVNGDLVNAMMPPTYRQGFARLWREINGADSWDANPWVWVVEFKRVTP